jgi:flagellar biosynthesis protein FlhG
VGTAELSSIADAYALLKVMVHDYKLDNFLYLPNQVDNEQQGLKLFESMDNVVGNFLNASLHYVGSVSKDPMVNLSWQKSTPMLRLAPSAVIASNFRQVAKALLARPISRQTSGAVQFFMGQT